MKKIPISLLALLFFNASPAQYYFYDATHLEPEWRWETGLSAGIMNCLTDLGGKSGKGKKFVKDIIWKNARFCGGLFASVAYHDIIAFRLEGIHGMVSGCDSILKNDGSIGHSRYIRNLHFRSRISEISLLAEFHPLFIKQHEILPWFSPYVIAGPGYFAFNPQAKIDRNWVDLQPLHTEGQGMKEFPNRQEYKLHQFCFMAGLGIRKELTTHLVVRLECIYRLLSTDYLDDASTNYIDPMLFYKYFPAAKAVLAERLADRQAELNPFHTTSEGSIRGNPGNKDAYFSINLKVSLIMNRKLR